MKYKPKPQRSITLINRPGQVVSVDLTGPFKVRSIFVNIYALAFIGHYVNKPFTCALKVLRIKFLLDFRELFQDTWKVAHVRILRSDNAKAL